MKPPSLLVPGLCLAIASSCVSAAADTPLTKGRWAGEAAIFVVVDGGAEIEFECARGRIDKAVAVDRNGDFDMAGTLTPDGPGPARDEGAGSAARYQGHVKGTTMTLVVWNGDKKVGSYELTRDREVVLRKCR